jgi:hypothetical protein
MSSILRLLHPLSCWDLRDKLYALIACFAALGITGLPPGDYDLPVARVYADYVRAAIRGE